MNLKLFALALCLTLIPACGGGGKSSPTPPVPPGGGGTTPPPVTTGIKGTFRALKTPQASIKEGAASVASTTMTPRVHHRAIQMMNGKVLIVGGDKDFSVLPSMDIYDPVTETFTQSAAHLPVLLRHAANTYSVWEDFALVNLPDGKVAIIGCPTGGQEGQWIACHYFFIYDPVADTLDQRIVKDVNGETGVMIHLDSVSTAYYIGNGQVMIFNAFGLLQRLDLATGVLVSLTFNSDQFVPYLIDAPTIQDANGNIWQFGGKETALDRLTVAYAFMYNPATNTWARKKSMANPRSGAALALLDGNKIGIYGGVLQNGTTTDAVEIYDIAADTITPATAMIGGRFNTTGAFLQTGFTLIAGGESPTGTVDSEIVHRYDASINFSGSTGSMQHPRSGHTVTPLNNGLVLVAGGGDANACRTAEVYDPLAKLLVQFVTETTVVGTTQTFSTTYAAGVNWSSNKPSVATIDAVGTLTALTPGEVEITATAKDDATTTAKVRIRVIPQ